VIAQRFGLKIIIAKDISKEEQDKGNPVFVDALKAGTYVPDTAMIEAVKAKVDAFEAKRKSYVIVGYPRTKVQAIALQRAGVIPERVVVFQGDRDACVSNFRERYGLILGEKLDPQAKLHLIESPEMEEAGLAAWEEYNYHINGVKEAYDF
jgi:adenylate kinase family enzyme